MLRFLVKSSLDVLESAACRNFGIASCRHNSTRCLFSKQSRLTYPRMYKTRLYLEDGSSIMVRCKTPRKFIQLPLDFAALDDNEQRRVWLSRKTKVESDEADSSTSDQYDSSKYRKFWK